MRCTPPMLKPCSCWFFSRKSMGVASPMAHVQRASCSWLEARVSSRVHYKVGASKMERMFREGIGWDGWGWCWFLDFLCSITFQFDPTISSYSQIFCRLFLTARNSEVLQRTWTMPSRPQCFFGFSTFSGQWVVFGQHVFFSGRLTQFYWNTSLINHN